MKEPIIIHTPMGIHPIPLNSLVNNPSVDYAAKYAALVDKHDALKRDYRDVKLALERDERTIRELHDQIKELCGELMETRARRTTEAAERQTVLLTTRVKDLLKTNERLHQRIEKHNAEVATLQAALRELEDNPTTWDSGEVGAGELPVSIKSLEHLKNIILCQRQTIADLKCAAPVNTPWGIFSADEDGMHHLVDTVVEQAKVGLWDGSEIQMGRIPITAASLDKLKQIILRLRRTIVEQNEEAAQQKTNRKPNTLLTPWGRFPIDFNGMSALLEIAEKYAAQAKLNDAAKEAADKVREAIQDLKSVLS